MREIAFRVWDHAAAAWHHFSLRPLSELADLTGRDYDETSLSQDTGIKDKLGNPIFEGDLLRDRLGTRCTVTFESGRYMLEQADKSTSWPLSTNGDHYEVIGNIIESPAAE